MVPQSVWQQLQTIKLPPALQPLPPQQPQTSSSAPAHGGGGGGALAASVRVPPRRSPDPQQPQHMPLLQSPHRPRPAGGSPRGHTAGGAGTVTLSAAGRTSSGDGAEGDDAGTRPAAPRVSGGTPQVTAVDAAAAVGAASARRHDAAPAAAAVNSARGGQQRVAPSPRHPGAALQAQQQALHQLGHQQRPSEPPLHSDLERLICAVTPVLMDPGQDGPPLTLVRRRPAGSFKLHKPAMHLILVQMLIVNSRALSHISLVCSKETTEFVWTFSVLVHTKLSNLQEFHFHASRRKLKAETLAQKGTLQENS